jgi:tetratricopeptide (TPR) repeat protein
LIAFISSTSLDLPVERAAVFDACRALNLGVATMEDFPAMGTGATRGSLTHLEKAQIYIGIYAHRYGYIEPGYTISVTEAEYNHAVERGLECLCFFLAEGVPWPEEKMERSELPRLAAFKQRIQGERIVRWFRNPDHLRYEVFRALLDCLERVGERPRGPWQIGPPPPDFTGRDSELTTLLASFETGVTIVGARGLGGVGKTTLALALAQRLAARFPDGQIYIDLRGVGDDPVPVRDALSHVIRAWRPDESLPSDESALLGLYRTVLHGKRALLLMDNAADAPQVLPLVPPAGCGMLVTSRRRFLLPGLLATNLDALSPTAAADLLLSIAPRINGSSGIIAELCGYLPLALRLAATLMAERDDLPVSKYIERLRATRLSERSGLAEVAAAVQLSEEMLPRELRTRWRELSVLVGGFETGWASAVWDIDPDTADDWLGILRRNSLIEWSAAENWYRLHDLVSEYTASRLESLHRQIASQRHAIHFRKILYEADQLYETGGAFALAAQSFDRAWPNARIALTWAQQQPDSAELERESILNIDLANQIFEALWHLGRYEFARELLLKTTALQDRTLGADDPRVAITFSNLGDLEWTFGSLEEAKRCYQRAIAIELKHLTADHPNLAVRYSNLGRCEHDLGNIERAKQLFTSAIQIEEKHLPPDHPNLAIRYSNAARIELDVGNVPEARQLIMRAIEIEEHKLMRDHPNLAVRYAFLSRAEKLSSHPDQARTALLEAVRIGEIHYASHSWYFSLFGFSLGELEYEAGNQLLGLERAHQSYQAMREKLGITHPRTQRARTWLIGHDPSFEV